MESNWRPRLNPRMLTRAHMPRHKCPSPRWAFPVSTLFALHLFLHLLIALVLDSNFSTRTNSSAFIQLPPTFSAPHTVHSTYAFPKPPSGPASQCSADCMFSRRSADELACSYVPETLRQIAPYESRIIVTLTSFNALAWPRCLLPRKVVATVLKGYAGPWRREGRTAESAACCRGC